MWKFFDITPVAKPRMTRADKWKKRPSVVAYREYKDECRRLGVSLDERVRVMFFLPMPVSWSKKKRLSLQGQPHQQTPDIDNLLKGLLDAVLEDDAQVWHVEATKYWGPAGRFAIWVGEFAVERELDERWKGCPGG